MNDLVSIIVPVYNADRTFVDLIQCLFKQSYDEIEYVFVDDGSTNECMAILSEMIDRFPQRKDYVRVIHHGVNKGIASSRRTGVQAAKGTYIQFADSDDMLDYDMVSYMHKLICNYHADIAVCGYSREMMTHTNEQLSGVCLMEPYQCMKDALFGGSNALLWNKMIRRQLFLDNELYAPEGMSIYEDLNLIYKAFFFAESVVICTNKFYHWRVNLSSVSHNYSKKVVSQAPMLVTSINQMESFFDKNRITDSELVEGMIHYEKRVMIDLALYGNLTFLENNRSIFHRVNLNSILHSQGFIWYANLIALSFKYRLYPLLWLLRFSRKLFV